MKQAQRTLPSILVIITGIFFFPTAAAAEPLELVAINLAGGLRNGYYSGGPSISDPLSNRIMFSGMLPDGPLLWSRYFTSKGDIVKIRDQIKKVPKWPHDLQFASMNPKSSEVVILSYDEDDNNGYVRFFVPPNEPFREFKMRGPHPPNAIALLNSGNVVMAYGTGYAHISIHSRRTEEEEEYFEEEQIAIPIENMKRMAYDASADAIYVCGILSKEKKRAVARLDKDGESYSVSWIGALDAFKGVPVPLLRRNAAGEVSEIMLLSQSFYARLDALTGEQIYLNVGAMEWLPPTASTVAAYDPVQDTIYSVGGTTLRRHSIITGQKIWDLELNKGEIKDLNPSHQRSDFPPVCDRGGWKNVDTSDEKCTRKGVCSAYLNPPEGTWGSERGLKCSTDKVCCSKIRGGCCLTDDSYFFENWYRSGGAPQLKNVQVTSDGNVHVHIYYSGGVADEEGYYQSWLATYQVVDEEAGPNGGGEDHSVKCSLMVTRRECRQAITPTGCYWKRSRHLCIDAPKCEKIKKNRASCLGATTKECSWNSNTSKCMS